MDSHFRDSFFPESRPEHSGYMGQASSDNRAMPRSVWQDLAAIQGRTPRACLPADDGPGREIVYPGALYPNSAEHISDDVTEFLQVEGDIVLACSRT